MTSNQLYNRQMGKIERETVQPKQISKQILAKFKKVRVLQNQLYGNYGLYSKNGLKYIGKQLPKKYQLVTTRNMELPIFKYVGMEQSTFLFPLQGQSVQNMLGKLNQQGQIKRWVQKQGNIQNCLWQIIRKMLYFIDNYKVQQVILQCLRIRNGQVQYCYDSWMKNSCAIVLANQGQLQNYYFSHQDLEQMRTIIDRRVANNLKVNRKSLIFRICLMVLHLGSSNLKQRNYQYGMYKLNQEHLTIRLEYFCSRYNCKGLGDFVKKVIDGDDYEVDGMWRNLYEGPQKSRKVLTIKTNNNKIKIDKSKTQISENNNFTPNKESIVSKMQSSFVSNYSNTSNDHEAFNKAPTSIIMEEQKGRSNHSVGRSHIGSQLLKCKKSITLKKQIKKHYNFYPISNPPKLNFRNLLLQKTQIFRSIKILKYLGLQQHIPEGIYETKLLQALDKVYIKPTWNMCKFQNGSIYFGQMSQGKKQGKGLYLFDSNDLYYGDWSQNFMNGYGTYIFTSGEVYQGELKKGFKQGHGKCYYADGREYEGSWVNNNKIGLGSVKFPNGVTFIGVFQQTKSATDGMFLGPIGEDFKPIWQNKGILQHYQWQSNTMIEQEAKEKQQSSKIKKIKTCNSELYSEYSNDEGSYEGEMLNDRREGLGIWRSCNEVYDGGWSEDKRDGWGELEVRNMFKITGQWRGNMLVRYDYDNSQDIL